MSVIVVKCTDQVLIFENTPIITSGGRGENRIKFSFCAQWDGYVKTAVFWRTEHEPYHAMLDENNSCAIPYEVLTREGRFYFGVFGVNAGHNRRTSEVLAYMVAKGAITDGTQPSDPAPEIYDQLLAEYAATQAKYNETMSAMEQHTKALQKTVEDCVKAVQEKLVRLLPEVGAGQVGYYVRATVGGEYELAPPPLSAYESVKNSGYTGTEDEFYTALAALCSGNPGGGDPGGGDPGGGDPGGDPGDDPGDDPVPAEVIKWYLEDEVYNELGGEYEAESGMTWAVFIESKYNTPGFYIDGYGYVVGEGFIPLRGEGSTDVNGLDVIQADATYYLVAARGGGNV